AGKLFLPPSRQTRQVLKRRIRHPTWLDVGRAECCGGGQLPVANLPALTERRYSHGMNSPPPMFMLSIVNLGGCELGLECADMSALWNDATGRVGGKRCRATALQNAGAFRVGDSPHDVQHVQRPAALGVRLDPLNRKYLCGEVYRL